jgi:hypothetical protein
MEMDIGGIPHPYPGDQKWDLNRELEVAKD